jgi:hypothetical protein
MVESMRIRATVNLDKTYFLSRREWPWFLLFLLAGTFLWGCVEDRRAGTEVGNPEVTVAARFRLLQPGDSAQMDGLSIKVMEVQFKTNSGDSGLFWNQDSGTMVNMAQPASASGLPRVRLSTEPWKTCNLTLALPAGSDSLPTTALYQDENRHNWARWRIRNKTGFSHYLFYLPPELKLRLSYEQETMQAWHSQDTLFVTVTFDVTAFSNALPAGNWLMRKGVDGMDYYVVSPSENAEAYVKMLADFPQCFRADSWKAE